MGKKRELDTRERVQIVTKNDFIAARNLENATLKARKLLYIAMSQCRMQDKEFFEYTITIKDFAELMDIAPTNVYQKADRITDELMGGFVRTLTKDGYKKFNFFETCEYDGEKGTIHFELSKTMSRFLLGLKNDFTEALLSDFLRMRSRYSMAIWHLMMRELRQKPGVTDAKEFDLSLEELRNTTGTQEKFRQVGQFKEKVLDKALREIRDNCGVQITYTNIKKGRKVTGFHFTAVSLYHVDISTLPPEVLEKAEQIKHRISDNR